jgi:L-aminopeptidase/D-esterase-like protein
VRTSVTVILPHGDGLFHQKVRAAVHTISGYGKVGRDGHTRRVVPLDDVARVIEAWGLR